MLRCGSFVHGALAVGGLHAIYPGVRLAIACSGAGAILQRRKPIHRMVESVVCFTTGVGIAEVENTGGHHVDFAGRNVARWPIENEDAQRLQTLIAVLRRVQVKRRGRSVRGYLETREDRLIVKLRNQFSVRQALPGDVERNGGGKNVTRG